MDIMTAMLSILLVLILFLVMRRDPEKSRIKKMLSKIPGPPTYPILGNAWELINLPSHRYMDVLSKYSNDYGPIFCTWIGTKGIVSLNTAETAEKWRATRKLFSSIFSSTILDNYLQVFTKNTEILTQKFMAKIDGGEFDVCPYLARFTLDVVCGEFITLYPRHK
ncbi:cytochrome P450 4C1-like isoform X2 [Zootermopsis nevadensis]|uniref:cytochrome P450 4C1-like isoform X2 n=1 Tax=Zootermopsis nevadensis TaxID=136037 RepID=UPI000B8E4ED7|nr:cytochrome P450 4C1-like isoform X2 [Zootermopsis nevadensis]